MNLVGNNSFQKYWESQSKHSTNQNIQPIRKEIDGMLKRTGTGTDTDTDTRKGTDTDTRKGTDTHVNTQVTANIDTSKNKKKIQTGRSIYKQVKADT